MAGPRKKERQSVLLLSPSSPSIGLSYPDRCFRQLVALLSTCIDAISASRETSSTTFLPSLLHHTLTSVCFKARTLLDTISITLARHTLASLHALISQLATSSQADIEPLQTRVVLLIDVLDSILSNHSSMEVKREVLDELTKLIATIGVGELVGAEVEMAVLRLLRDTWERQTGEEEMKEEA
jgi:hypothetical protein